MSVFIVQGPELPPGVAAELSAAAGARQTTPAGPGILHLVGVTDAGALERGARAHRLDVTRLAAVRPLRDFRLLAMDMDSTLITIECIDEIADFAGVKPQVAAITAAAMRGELDFPGALRARVGLLKDLEASVLQRVYDERLRLSPGAETLLAAARAAGLRTLLVSGGFTYFTGRLQTRLGLDFTLANELEIVGGRLTGRVNGAIVDADAKAARVASACAELGCGVDRAIVIGDGANDLKMMRGAGLSVAYRAKPVVQQQAGAALNFSGLDGVLALCPG
ncbi:MAG: phosphoserine phosphatase SerB [Verrucomicrobiales bacterium]|nr:phosphoserine phosphatase SerB [Verrucomicrobiales bacterium]